MGFDNPSVPREDSVSSLMGFDNPSVPRDYCPPPPHHHRNFSTIAIVVICVLGGCFLLVSYYAVLAKYCSRRNRSGRNPGESNSTHEDLLDENHGPVVVDHPIWLINTIGLDKSIISSIPVCKYNKGDGLIEGTECSVCLNEFQDDEGLRLLPKCSHAFHLNCIDTWLRSHTNCPLCRAPIVVGPNSRDLGSREETLVEVSEVEGTDQSGEPESVEEERELQEKEGLPSLMENRELQVLDNFSNMGQEREVEDGMQAVRRSVSMDSSSLASIFCFSLGNSVPEEAEASSGTEAVGAKKSNVGFVSKHSGGSPGMFMKRSFSSGGKFLFSRGSRSQSSILPL